MAKENTGLNMCSDSTLSQMAGKATRTPGGRVVWDNFHGIPQDVTAAQLRGTGHRGIVVHQKCGMAKVAAERAHGRPLSQSDSDQWAYDETKNFGKKQGFAVMQIKKGVPCNCANNEVIKLVGRGITTPPKDGFVISKNTTPFIADGVKILSSVAKSRGVDNPRIEAIGTPRAVERIKQQLKGTPVDARIVGGR